MKIGLLLLLPLGFEAYLSSLAPPIRRSVNQSPMATKSALFGRSRGGAAMGVDRGDRSKRQQRVGQVVHTEVANILFSGYEVKVSHFKPSITRLMTL